MKSGAIFDNCRKLRQLLSDQDCLACGCAAGRELLCPACRADLPALPESCPRCALPSPAGEMCGRCLARPPHFDRTIAVWRYDFPCDRLIQALKYRACLPLAGFFAAALAPRTGGRVVDVVIPMPLHRTRLAERGFNPSVEIARELARRLGTPFARAGARRLRHTAQQTRLPFAARAANVRGAFACAADVRGKRIAVVDDVMTTGTTLEELARVLKAAGAAMVENWIVARTLLD